MKLCFSHRSPKAHAEEEAAAHRLLRVRPSRPAAPRRDTPPAGEHAQEVVPEGAPPRQEGVQDTHILHQEAQE